MAPRKATDADAKPKATSNPKGAKSAASSTQAAASVAESSQLLRTTKAPLAREEVEDESVSESESSSESEDSDGDPALPSASNNDDSSKLDNPPKLPKPQALRCEIIVSDAVRESSLVYPRRRVYRPVKLQAGEASRNALTSSTGRSGPETAAQEEESDNNASVSEEVSLLKALFAEKNPDVDIDLNAVYFRPEDDTRDKDLSILKGLKLRHNEDDDSDEESEVEPDAANFASDYDNRTARNDAQNRPQTSATEVKGKAKGKAKGRASHYAYRGLDTSRRPIFKIDEIFDEIARKALEPERKDNLEAVLQHLNGRKLRVGTMCSGTESPILALGLLNESLNRQCKPEFLIEHVFSCEIEPFKQAYIQRNFDPPILFRDVRELGGLSAHTAYGAKIEIPGNLDLLVAGSSCVDFSYLNSKRKDLEDEGESAQTLNGIVEYAKFYKPRIVVLENVSAAPWREVERKWQEIGYATKVAILDTKNFYIPQTRERGYMVAYHVAKPHLATLTQAKADSWFEALEQLQQRASAPFTNFLFHSDDPELHQAKQDMEMTSATKPIDWVKCRHRHMTYRSASGIGFERPFTGWQNNGSCKLPDTAWQGWGKSQVERIWDTIDINHLRSVALRDYDMFFKSRWVDLSQNMDRETDSRAWGLAGCITPSGAPYLTSRGGPVTGKEVLALQGIPTSKLCLTRETPRQLQDLAGNAMTSTVVGCSMIAALACGFGILHPGEKPVRTTPDKLTRDLHVERNPNQKLRRVKLPLHTTTHTSLAELESLADVTLQVCVCEGNATLKDRPLQQCVKCGHGSCKVCGLNPTHRYEDIPSSVLEKRKQPSEFETKIRQVLPLQMQISELHSSSLTKGKAREDAEDSEAMTAMKAAFNEKVTLTKIRRGDVWTITYEGQHSRLELIFRRKWASSENRDQDKLFVHGSMSTIWSLYAKPPPTDPTSDSLSQVLSQPIARMICSKSLFEGKWQIRLPKSISFTLEVQGVNKAVDSWEKKQGLLNPLFSERKVWKELKIRLLTERASLPGSFPDEILGTYEVCQDCSAACGTLHCKVETQKNQEAVFFFLDPLPLGSGAEDMFVFARTHNRLPHGESRDILSTVVESRWRPDAREQTRRIACTMPGNWETCDSLSLVCDIAGNSVDLFISTREPLVNIDWSLCKESWLPMLALSFPLDYGSSRQLNSQTTTLIDLVDQPAVLGQLSYLLQRASQTCTSEEWRDVKFSNGSLDFCSECAPASPLLTWKEVHKLIEDKSSSSKEAKEPDVKHVNEVGAKLVNEAEAKPKEEKRAEKTKRTAKQPVNQALKSSTQKQVSKTVNTEDLAKTDGKGPQPSRKSNDEEPTKKKYKIKVMVEPFEDPIRAFEFEKNMKTRPSPVRAYILPKQLSATLHIDMNVLALAHRAHAKLSIKKPWLRRPDRIQWRLAADYGSEEVPLFPRVALLSNMDDTKSAQPPNFKARHLEENQLKSLTWMLDREKPSAKPWTECEIEEARIPSANLRLEAKVELNRTVLGGVLADEVGFGKTATVLGLIDTSAGGQPMASTSTWHDGYKQIRLKATLIMVPKNLIDQWTGEISKFLPKPAGSKNGIYNLIVLKGLSGLNKLTIEDMTKADIILASWSMFDNSYFNELAKLCHANNLPEKPGRAFNEWLQQALNDLGDLVLRSKGCESDLFYSEWNAKKGREVEYDRYFMVSKRDKDLGASATKSPQDLPNPQQSSSSTASPVIGDKRPASPSIQAGATKRQKTAGKAPEKLVKKNKIPPLLHLFKFHRLVIDEFTYCAGNPLSAMLELVARRRWILSGTPPLGSFGEINSMAKLLGTRLSNDDDGLRYESRKIMREKLRDSSSAEEFRSYQVSHSPVWYSHRHRLALEFLKQFVRQNRADTAQISRCNHFQVVNLSASERATYFEVYQSLMSKNINFTGKPSTKEFSQPPSRTEQLLELIRASVCPEDALLTVCSTKTDFAETLGQKLDGQEICDNIVAEKENHYCNTLRAILDILQEAFARWRVNGKEPAEVNPHFHAYLRCIQKNRLGDEVSHSILTNILEHTRLVIEQAPIEEVSQDLKQRIADQEAEKKKEDQKKGKQAKEPGDKGDEKKDAMKVLATELTNLSINLIDDLRALRFFKAIQCFASKKQLPTCSRCGQETKDLNTTIIMGICGHISCTTCFDEKTPQATRKEECVAPGCTAPAPRHSTIRASVLARDQPDAASSHGSKLDVVIELLRDLLKDKQNPQDKEYVLIFVQFDRVRATLAKALQAHDIPFTDSVAPFKVNLLRKAGRDSLQAKLDKAEQIASQAEDKAEQTIANRGVGVAKRAFSLKDNVEVAIEKFKNGAGGRVCVLDINNVNAAGWNLQIANHVIFLSSLVTSTQYQYTSRRIQAIGRALRKNQKKDVHVYDCLAAQTIDVNILQDRERKTLVKRGSDFLLVDEVEEGDDVGWEGTPLQGVKDVGEDWDDELDEKESPKQE